jgi:hypothetical protein
MKADLRLDDLLLEDFTGPMRLWLTVMLDAFFQIRDQGPDVHAESFLFDESNEIFNTICSDLGTMPETMRRHFRDALRTTKGARTIQGPSGKRKG